MALLRYVLQCDPRRQVSLAGLVLVEVVLSLAPVHFVRVLVNDTIPRRDAESLAWWTGLTLACVLGRTLVQYLQTMTVESIRNCFITRLRSELFDHVMRLGAEWHASNHVGQTLNRIQNDVGRLGVSVAWIFVQPLVEGMTFVLYVAYLASISPRLTLVGLVVLPLVAAAVPAVDRALARHAAEFIAARGRYSARLQQSLQAVEEVQVQGTFGYERAIADQAQQQVAAAWLRLTRVQAILAALVELARGLGTLAVVALAGWMVIHAELALGTLVAFAGALGGVYLSADRLLKYPPSLRNAVDRFAELREVLVVPQCFGARAPLTPDPPPSGVHVEHLTYRMPGRAPLLSSVSLDVPAGQRVALVGRSGCGKSTLLRILAGRATLYTGRVCVAGAAPGARPHALGFVAQVPTIFDGSIRENLLYGLQRRDVPGSGEAPFLDLAPLGSPAPGSPALDDALLDACEAVGLLDDLRAKAEGEHGDAHQRALAGLALDPGERGGRLSGGQRQKLALARVLLRRSSVLLLDEVTAGLDRGSAAHVEEALAQRWSGCTVIAATHDLEWLSRFDRVVVLAEGRIVADGPPLALLREGGPLRAVATRGQGCEAGA